VDGAVIRQLAAIAHPGLSPDLTIVFDVPANGRQCASREPWIGQ
jgi:hypothetical protein